MSLSAISSIDFGFSATGTLEEHRRSLNPLWISEMINGSLTTQPSLLYERVHFPDCARDNLDPLRNQMYGSIPEELVWEEQKASRIFNEMLGTIEVTPRNGARLQFRAHWINLTVKEKHDTVFQILKSRLFDPNGKLDLFSKTQRPHGVDNLSQACIVGAQKQISGHLKFQLQKRGEHAISQYARNLGLLRVFSFYNALLDFKFPPEAYEDEITRYPQDLSPKKIKHLVQILRPLLSEKLNKSINYMDFLAKSSGINQRLLHYFIINKVKSLSREPHPRISRIWKDNFEVFCAHYPDLDAIT